jgi:hypothetical protein
MFHLSDSIAVTLGMYMLCLLSYSSSASEQHPPITLVVSHCKHDLHWLTNLTTSFPIHDIAIYSKCGYPVLGAPLNSKIKLLQNVGRCDHTYAHFITELSLTDGIVLFLKDTTHVYCPYEGKTQSEERGVMSRRSYQTMIEAAVGPDQFSCRQFVDPGAGMSNDVVAKQLLRMSIPLYKDSLSNYSNGQVEPFSIHTYMRKWKKEVGITFRHPITPVCYGGIFAVNVKRLLAIKRDTWAAIRTSLSRADNIQEGHFMVRRTVCLSFSLLYDSSPPICANLLLLPTPHSTHTIFLNSLFDNMSL